jgi:hypothetical protein
MWVVDLGGIYDGRSMTPRRQVSKDKACWSRSKRDNKAFRIASLIETVEKWWWIAQDVVFSEAHCLSNRDTIVEEIMVRELPAFVSTRTPLTDRSEIHRDSFWFASRSTSSRIQYVELACSKKMRKTL